MSDPAYFVSVGQEVTFGKTVSESDVYLFAGLTGDLSANHVNEAVMAKSKFGRRVAHGALVVGFMQKYDRTSGVGTVVSLMLPYTVWIFLLWTALFAVWKMLGLPWGL